jgi:hypothetical protein
VFDEPVFILGLDSVKPISVEVTVYSKNLLNPQVSEVVLDPSNAQLIELSYTNTDDD